MHTTAVAMAAKGGHTAIIRILIDHGADVNLTEFLRYESPP